MRRHHARRPDALRQALHKLAHRTNRALAGMAITIERFGDGADNGRTDNHAIRRPADRGGLFGRADAKADRHRDCIWFSPSCIDPNAWDSQPLFSDLGSMTTITLAAWAEHRGATPPAARGLARTLVGEWAGRTPPLSSATTPARALLARARRTFSRDVPLAECTTDPDGTLRFSVRLSDEALVETVVIPHPRRTTICLSTQSL